MRIVIDTNMIMSAIYLGGLPRRMVDAPMTRKRVFIISTDPDDDTFIAAALES
jgi:predicted nucleic acid-binding protein